MHLRSAKRFLKLCEVNRGFYTKAGQFVAAMGQAPKEYVTTLSSLQDKVLFPTRHLCRLGHLHLSDVCWCPSLLIVGSSLSFQIDKRCATVQFWQGLVRNVSPRHLPLFAEKLEFILRLYSI